VFGFQRNWCSACDGTGVRLAWNAHYAGWFLYALKLTYPDEVPLADGEGGALGMYSREDVIPPPPPGYAGRTLPHSVAAQEASAVAASGIHVATVGGF
jgi:hypothetical protein